MYIAIAIIGAAATIGSADTSVRRSTWTFGLRSISYDFSSTTATNMNGQGGSVDFGYGYIGDQWFGYGSLSSLSGPFDSIRRDRVSLDFTGTGLTFLVGFAPLQNNVRSGSFAISAISGMSVSDLAGRSVGRVEIKDQQPISVSDENDAPTVDRQIRSYTMQVNEFSILGGFAISLLAPGRPKGNTPTLLRTEFDGVLAIFSASMPISARYKSKFEQSIKDGPYESRKQKGRLSGISFIVGLTTLIGV